MFVQLPPPVQSTFGHDQSCDIPELSLHKDEPDPILGDVSEAQSQADKH